VPVLVGGLRSVGRHGSHLDQHVPHIDVVLLLGAIEEDPLLPAVGALAAEIRVQGVRDREVNAALHNDVVAVWELIFENHLISVAVRAALAAAHGNAHHSAGLVPRTGGLRPRQRGNAWTATPCSTRSSPALSSSSLAGCQDP